MVDKAAYDVIGALEEQNEFHTPETLKDPKTASYLKEKLGQEYEEEDLTDILEAVTELTEQGKLFARDVYEDFIDEVKQRKQWLRHCVCTLPMTVILPVNTASPRKANTTDGGRLCPMKWERRRWTS